MSAAVLYLLDTNMAAYIVSGRSQAAQQAYLDAGLRSRIAISAVTEGEIRFGLAKRPEAFRTRLFTEQFLGKVHSLPWDSPVAQTYGTLRASLTAVGQTLSPLDLMIAAHALALSATLVTHDQAFHRLAPMLSVVDWASDL
ncbi:type II toxin-antitoxin system VapC family toxin [Terriglobus sp.]|uniref:type II toxin-antitoxin system VapC family toxin n=1 Tax=Terriglobus sp. TaxID=1889013 RepID=UPI003AFFB2E5